MLDRVGWKALQPSGRAARHPRSAARPLILACLLTVLLAPVAHADLAPVNSPGGGVDGFAASQGAWLIGLSVSGQKARRARVTRDRGQTWSEVTLPTGPNAVSGEFSGVVVGPDRAFYVAVRYTYALSAGVFGRLLRIEPANGAVSIVGNLPAPDAGASLSAPAFDAQGRLWVAWVPGGGSATLTVARIAGGAAAETYQAPAPSTTSPNGEIQFRPSGMWVRMGNLVYRLAGGALVSADRGIPVFEEGSLMITERAMSLDGGQTFGRLMARTREVEGNPALLASDSRILRRYSSAMFSATAQSWSGTITPLMTRVVATDGGVVAFSDEWREPRVTTASLRMLWHAGAVTDTPFSTGPLTDTFTRWLTDANRLRAQAGLPPLFGHAAIATAAENHSRYWTMNAPSASVSPHAETPGTPGFTGANPSARCAYAGAPAFCGEIMYSAGVADPIATWAATVWHSSEIMSPTSLAVGGGQVAGGRPVMNGGESGGLLVGPVMFPRGSYSGPMWLADEFPDASAGCYGSGQGTGSGRPIFVWVPGGTLSGFTLTPDGGQPVLTCKANHAYLPNGGLSYATTYTASVRWQPAPDTAAQQITWQFTTGERPPTPPVTLPGSTSALATQPRPQLPAGATAAVGAAASPAKLQVLRAGVRSGRLDVFAQITGRATGAVQVSYQSSGVTTRFSAPIRNATISIARRLPAAQRRKSTGILTVTYTGNADVRGDVVRLRAASGKAGLTRHTTLIDGGGRLRVSGTITKRARGVVRIRLEYTAGNGRVELLNHTAKIHDGDWSLTRALPAAVAKSGGQLSIQFTGYEARRIRGEQLAKAVAPA